jgi:hypothetical protein
MWRVIPLTVLLVALVFALQIYIDENRRLIARSLLVREDVAKLDPGRRPIVWGAAFPYEVALPVLERDTRLGSFRHIALGWESLAPFSLDSVRELGWHDLTDRLARDKDIPLIAEKSQIALLSTYCHEHHHKNLKIRDRPLNTFTVHYVTCGDH